RALVSAAELLLWFPRNSSPILPSANRPTVQTYLRPPATRSKVSAGRRAGRRSRVGMARYRQKDQRDGSWTWVAPHCQLLGTNAPGLPAAFSRSASSLQNGTRTGGAPPFAG